MVSSVLVTGGLGGLGSVLVSHLVKETSATVVIVDNLRNPSADPRSFGPRVHFYRGDVRNGDLLSHLLSKHSVDTVIDCSSRAAPRSVLDAANILKNFTHLLEAIRPHKELKHFVLASRPQQAAEDEPLCPKDFGLAALMSVEAMLHSYVISYRLPLITARVGYFPERIPALRAAGQVNLISSADAARGVMATLSSPPASVFNIVGPQDFDVSTKETVPTRFSRDKAAKELDFTAGEVKITEQTTEDAPTGLEKVFVFGKGSTAEKLKMQLEKERVAYEEAATWPGNDTDKDVADELTRVAPSHVVCLSNSDIFEGDGTPCEKLKNTTYGLLFPPWQLASLCEKRGIHYTFIGSDELFSPEELKNAPITEDVNGNNQETYQGPVRAYTERLLNHFPEALKFRLGEASLTDSALHKIIRLLLTRSNGLWNVVESDVPSHLDGCKFQQLRPVEA